MCVLSSKDRIGGLSTINSASTSISQTPAPLVAAAVVAGGMTRPWITSGALLLRNWIGEFRLLRCPQRGDINELFGRFEGRKRSLN